MKKKKRIKKYALMIKVRKALNDLWKIALLKGRCLGPETKDNPYAATNIILATDMNLVSVSQTPKGKIKVHEFCRCTGCSLGTEIKVRLIKAGLVLEEEE